MPLYYDVQLYNCYGYIIIQGYCSIIKRGMSQNSCISDAIILWHPSFLQQAFTVIWAPAVNKEKKCCSKYNSGQLLYWGNATRFL